MKKIMFSERYGLEQAVLAGTKTMTRRVDKKLNHPLVTDISEWGINDKGKCYLAITYSTGLTEAVYPPYQIGEEIAIAQPYKQCWDIYQKRWESYNDPSNWRTPDAILGDSVQETAGWKNKMYVKAEYMPHRIRITNIKLERLQDIIEEDCLREGIKKMEGGMPYRFDDNGKVHLSADPRMLFADLIDRISGKGTWKRNPWVFAYEFELVR